MPWNNNCFCSVKALSLAGAGFSQTLSCHVPLAFRVCSPCTEGRWLPEGTREQEDKLSKPEGAIRNSGESTLQKIPKPLLSVGFPILR